MASSKNKLTEEQLVEGVFEKILNRILNKRIDTVAKAFADNPRLKKASKEVAKAHDNLKKELKKQGIKGKMKTGKESPGGFFDRSF
jgi:hypothetical protein